MGWITSILVVLVVVAVIHSPAKRWSGHKSFTLTLSPSTAADTVALFFQEEGNLDAGQRLCEFYRKGMPVIEKMFLPVTVMPDGKFTVEVTTFGTTRIWGLWRQQGMFEYVILMGKKATGDRVYKCVPVKSQEPIDLK